MKNRKTAEHLRDLAQSASLAAVLFLGGSAVKADTPSMSPEVASTVLAHPFGECEIVSAVDKTVTVKIIETPVAQAAREAYKHSGAVQWLGDGLDMDVNVFQVLHTVNGDAIERGSALEEVDMQAQFEQEPQYADSLGEQTLSLQLNGLTSIKAGEQVLLDLGAAATEHRPDGSTVERSGLTNCGILTVANGGIIAHGTDVIDEPLFTTDCAAPDYNANGVAMLDCTRLPRMPALPDGPVTQ